MLCNTKGMNKKFSTFAFCVFLSIYTSPLGFIVHLVQSPPTLKKNTTKNRCKSISQRECSYLCSIWKWATCISKTAQNYLLYFFTSVHYNVNRHKTLIYFSTQVLHLVVSSLHILFVCWREEYAEHSYRSRRGSWIQFWVFQFMEFKCCTNIVLSGSRSLGLSAEVLWWVQLLHKHFLAGYLDHWVCLLRYCGEAWGWRNHFGEMNTELSEWVNFT